MVTKKINTKAKATAPKETAKAKDKNPEATKSVHNDKGTPMDVPHTIHSKWNDAVDPLKHRDIPSNSPYEANLHPDAETVYDNSQRVPGWQDMPVDTLSDIHMVAGMPQGNYEWKGPGKRKSPKKIELNEADNKAISGFGPMAPGYNPPYEPGSTPDRGSFEASNILNKGGKGKGKGK